MISTIINCITVLVGSILGIILHKKINDELKSAVFTALGVFTIVIGISMAMDFSRVLYIVLSMVAGGIWGTVIKIEDKLLGLGQILEKHFDKSGDQEGTGRFAHGFLNASLLFCVGALTIVGAFKAGMEGDHSLIYTKSIMDGFSAMALAAAQGIGVAFSIIVLLLYQGGLTLASSWLGDLVSPLTLSELSAVGGMLIVMIGINLLNIRKIKTANFLPALVLIIIFTVAEPHVLTLWEQIF